MHVGDSDVAVQEQVALNKPFCRLLRFKRFTDDLPALEVMKSQPTVLIVAPLSGHHSTLLRETVRAMLANHKVYITDWTDARMVPASDGPFHLTTMSAMCRSSSATSGRTCMSCRSASRRCRCWLRSR